MSVDKLRGSRHINVVKPSDIGLLLAAQSYRPDVTNAIRKIKQFDWLPLQAMVENTISPGPHPAYGGSYPCLKTKNVQDLIADSEPADFADISGLSKPENAQVCCGDLLINLTGAGSIGRVSVYYGESKPITNQHIARMSVKPEFDEGYVAAFLRSWWGERALEQGVAGSTGQINMVNDHVRSVPVITPNILAQKYIGDKVRQAKQLRAWAKQLQDQIKELVTTSAIDGALSVANRESSWAPSADLTPRLDPKYYGNKALAVFHATADSGVPLRDLVVGICNGFEEREFFEDGITYITVSEVSSGRLDVSSAPKIHPSTDIPSKARVNDKCVLVVRTGSIGTAVKVDGRDSDAVISSHLIKLEFVNAETAAAVASFLNSEGGKVLLHKISYGAVQPQIGQDELLALPIPQSIIDQAEELLRLMTVYEDSIRSTKSLVLTAKSLVEALIEGTLTEQQLINTQKALETDDTSLDRDILDRLTTKGLDGDGNPLFADLNQLYDLLAQSQSMDE
tara:strand:- start:430 stop:1959 length:1530 start_codon:yes stop_codon:yes gene_type:complete